MTLPVHTGYTIRYVYEEAPADRQGTWAPTKAGKEMADLNAHLQNAIVQVPSISATVQEIWFSPDTGYEYRDAEEN